MSQYYWNSTLIYKTYLKHNDSEWLEIKRWKDIYQATTNKKKAMVACKIGSKVKKQWTDKHVVNLPR